MRFKAVIFSLGLWFSLNGYAWTHLGTGLYGWKPGKIPVYVNTTNCSIAHGELYAIIDKALALWNSAPNTNIELIRIAEEATKTESEFISQGNVATLPADISQVPLILCSTDFTQYGLGPTEKDSILAFVPFFRTGSDGGYVKFSGMVLNATGGQSDLSNPNLSQEEIEIVVAHEMGHVLGLGHSSDPDALMYFQLNKSFLLLTQDDQDGMAQLYPKNALGDLMGCAAVHKATTNLPMSGVIAFGLFMLIVIFSARWFFSTEPLRESEG